MNIRTTVFTYGGALSILIAMGVSGHAQSPGPGNDLLLWYRQPAEKWTEALPIGNGRLGAMIFGGVEEDHLQFNESTLWSGGPRHYEHPGAAAYLGPIRQLLAEGQQAKAEELAEKHFMGLKDRDDAAYAMLKEKWLAKVRRDTGFARTDLDESGWNTMTIPTPDGWEAAGLQGLDGAVWFRTSFELPVSWSGEDVALDLGRIRDMDYTYVNGQLVGEGEGISSKRHYIIPAAVLHSGRNILAIQVINFDDKGGLTGVKSGKEFVLEPVKGGVEPLVLPAVWKYRIQDEEPPLLPKYQADYLPFGDLYLRFPGQEKFSNYRRQLDPGNAIAGVSYDCAGTHYTREYFASVPQQVIVTHIGADRPGAVDVEMSLTTPHRLSSIRRIDDHTLGLFLKVRNGVLKGVSYLHVTALHGQVVVSGDKIIVKGADEVTAYLAAATSFVNYQNVSGDPEAACKAVMAGLKGHDHAFLRAAHVREYQQYFNAFSVKLGATTNADLPTDERILQYSPEKDAALLALYIQYGRYLLIAASRPGAPLPANLQGIWNDLLSPPWGSKFTTNINLEMNYWPAEELNLSACSQPFFRLVRDLSAAGSLTAKAHYNAQGWVLHHNTDIWRGTAPINASNHGIWVSGGAWLCHQLWEHYLFTRDKDFLRQYYPIMKGAAQFFVDFLIKDPAGTGWLISDPSNSPEHGGLVAGPTMDHEIIRDLFSNCMTAEKILGVDAAFSDVLSKKYKEIAPDRIGKYGQLQEWLEDKDDTADTHRHISHLWGVYPGTEISWKDTALMKAARQSMIYRGDAGTGWSLAWKVNCWARFKDGDHALRLANKLLSSAAGAQSGEHGGVYPNMFDAHPPFQIDGNFGGAAGIAEMLLQSQDGYMELLPALPAALPSGEVRGICARGGFELDIKWFAGVLQEVDILSRVGGEAVLRYDGKELRLSTHAGEHIRLSGDLKIIK